MQPSFIEGLLHTQAAITPANQIYPFRASILYEPRGGSVPKFAGLGRIEGKVHVISSPAPSKIVRLYHKGSGALVQETVSNAQGNYVFDLIDDTQVYYAVAIDDVDAYDPAISPMVDLST